MKVNVNFKCFSIVVFKLLRVMIKLFLNRFRRDHGAIVGRLSQEVVNRQGIVVGHQYICDTMEREGGCLEPGEYHIMVAKCKCFARQMLFLEPIRDDSSSSSSSSLPLPETCKLCRLERKSHEFGCLEELYTLPCPMMQPGNGPFRLRHGGILIGEAHAPGFVLRSQELFLQLFDRVKKAMVRGSEVVVEVGEEMG